MQQINYAMAKRKIIRRRNKPHTFAIGGALANAGATAVSGLINPSGNSTGVGNAMQTIGSVASNIPGVGGLIGAGVNMLGGVILKLQLNNNQAMFLVLQLMISYLVTGLILIT